MKIPILTAATLVVIATTLTAQDLSRTYSCPKVPSPEALDRLNLKMAWRAYVPTEGRRDGLLSVQVADQQVLVQTRSGRVIALNAETGETQWRTQIGLAYLANQPLGYNSTQVFAVNGSALFCLDRFSGQVQWAGETLEASSAPPVADDYQAYLSLASGAVHIYAPLRPVVDARKPGEKQVDIPLIERERSYYGSTGVTTASVGPLATARQASIGYMGGFTPTLVGQYRTNSQLYAAPVLGGDALLFGDSRGTVVSMSKFKRPAGVGTYPTDGAIRVPLGQHGEMAYVASDDANVYAFEISTCRLLWRHNAGTPPLHQPNVSDADVFVVPQRAGLLRLDRLSGEPIWQNASAERFLAANPKFVYARDRNGRLLVLDLARGTQLSAFDIREFVFPVSNNVNDRLYLAANDGLLVCLHDRQFAKPVPLKKEEVLLPPPTQDGKSAPKPPTEKPKDMGESIEQPKAAEKEMKKEN